MYVVKRNGSKAEFNSRKILAALKRAYESSDEELTNAELEAIVNNTIQDCFDGISVEDIQDILVENIQKVSPQLAQLYSKYRSEREALRIKNIPKLTEAIKDIVEEKVSDVTKENSNRVTNEIATKMQLIGEEANKFLFLSDPDIKDVVSAHAKGAIHVHDTSYWGLPSTNCHLWNMDDILQNGTVINGVQINKPHSLQVASTVLSQVLSKTRKDCYGGMTVSIATLAPFVKIDHDNLVKEYGKLTNSKEKLEEAVNNKLLKNIKAAIQTLNYQIQTLSDDIFVSLVLDLYEKPDYYKETKALIEEVLRQRIQGLPNEKGQYVTQAFPKLLFITYDNLFTEETELMKLVAESTAKRMAPDFISAKKSKGYKEGNIIPCMGCVSGKEVISYKINDEDIYTESFERAWNRLSNLFEVITQPTGEDYYMNLENVEIWDSTSNNFVEFKRIIQNHDRHNWVRIKTSNGRLLTCTLDHPLNVLGKGRTLVKDIKIGDEIEGAWNTYQGLRSFDKDYMWAIGLLLCDSYYSSTNITGSFAFTGEDDIIERLCNFIRSRNLIPKIKEWHRGTKGDYKEVQLDIENPIEERRKFVKLIIKDFGGIKKNDRKIPSFVFNTDRETRLHFLGGIIDADGYIHDNGSTHFCQVEIGSTNKELALEQLQLVNSLGLYGKIIENHYKKSNPNSIRYQVSFLCKEDILPYITCQKKKDKFRFHKEVRKKRNFIVSDISPVETEDEYSYDVTTSSDRFDVSGIASHNCRSFLQPWKDENGVYKIWGRGNLGVVTLNLPYIILEAKENNINWQKNLKKYFKLAMKAHRKRIHYIANSKVDVAPIIWMYGAISRAKSGTLIKDIIKNGRFSCSIGYVGLSEAVYALGIPYTTPEGQKRGLEILQALNDLCEKAREQSPLNIYYSIYGTPMESSVKKFANSIKKFPLLAHVNDRAYITNSYHVPVEYNINAFDKFDFEAPFQEYSTGGAITYCESGNLEKNLDAVLELIKDINDKMLYAEINVRHADVCHKCGYHGEIKFIDGKWTCPNCGNTDIRQMTRIRRSCGYLSSNDWNTARTDEINHRVIHIQ